MAWIGYDEKYLDSPFTNRAVEGMIGRPYRIGDRSTYRDFLFQNAEGYEQSGTLPKVKTMKKTPVSEPLPGSILAEIRARAAAEKKAARKGG